MIHHFSQSIQRRTSDSWGRIQNTLKKTPPSSRFPIPLALPCEIMLGVMEMLPPESVVAVVCCCQYMHGLYTEEGTFVADQLWDQLLRRTFPARLTGAPGPNAPPRLRRGSNHLKLSNKLTLSALSSDWVQYVRELRAVRCTPLPPTTTTPPLAA